jgi:hypothetical protein
VGAKVMGLGFIYFLRSEGKLNGVSHSVLTIRRAKRPSQRIRVLEKIIVTQLVFYGSGRFIIVLKFSAAQLCPEPLDSTPHPHNMFLQYPSSLPLFNVVYLLMSYLPSVHYMQMPFWCIIKIMELLVMEVCSPSRDFAVAGTSCDFRFFTSKYSDRVFKHSECIR